MNKKQAGFTLIELVMVIVILGILAAVAIPKFVDLSDEANQAAVQGVAGGLSSASATNFAAKKAGSSSAVAINAAAVCDSGVLDDILQSGWPTDFSVSAPGADDCSLTTVDAVSCTVSKGGKTATATILCAR